MSIETAELALMRIDGVGGPVDGPGARALVADCFDDVTRQAIDEHADVKERNPWARALDFCGEVGGTTITIDECLARHNRRLDAARALEAKAVAGDLDDEARPILVASEKAYDAYVRAVGDFVYEVYVQGTIRGAMALDSEAALLAVHASDLAALKGFVAGATSGRELDAARLATAAALARVTTATPAEVAALRKTQTAWEAYRDADIALYVRVFGPAQGADRVRATRGVRLEVRRAKECGPPSASGE
jgi:hypothetical protein